MRRFRAILAQDGVETAEGFLVREFPAGAFEWDPAALPLPLRRPPADMGAHHGAVLVGGIQQIERQGAWIVALGFFDDEGAGDAADFRRDVVRQVELGIINTLSVDPGPGGVEVQESCDSTDADGFCEKFRITFTRYSIGGATAVDIPGLEGTLIELLPEEGAEDVTAAEALDAIAASAAEAHVPLVGWFDDPELEELTRVPVVTEDGRVYGHLAGWSDCHLSFADYCQTPWRSQAAYAYFHTCSVDASDGRDEASVHVGPLSVSGGHFPTSGPDARNWQMAQEHYDDPATVAAYVRVGEDEHGIWFAGALRQGVTEDQVALFRAHQLSGDWRRIDGHMELIAGCSVNVPGFVRSVAVAASATGEVEPVAAVVAGAQARSAAEPCCDACAASGSACGHASAEMPRPGVPTIDLLEPERLGVLEGLTASVRRIESAMEPTIRERLRARLAGKGA